jgi:hypothetical protein
METKGRAKNPGPLAGREIPYGISKFLNHSPRKKAFEIDALTLTIGMSLRNVRKG